MTRNDIRRTLDVIYDKIFNEGQADLLPGLVAGPYIQHNPLFPNGLDGIMGYIKQAGRIPCEVKRIAIDGDLAFVHVRYLDWAVMKPPVLIFSASMPTVRSSSTGMCCNPYRPLPTTPIRCSSNHRIYQRSEAFYTRKPPRRLRDWNDLCLLD